MMRYRRHDNVFQEWLNCEEVKKHEQKIKTWKSKGQKSEKHEKVEVIMIRCALLVLLIVGSIQIVKSLLSLLLDLGQVHQGCWLVVLQLGGSISLQETGLGT